MERDLHIGKFFLAAAYVLTASPEARGILSQCVVLRVEYMVVEDIFEYTAICDRFPEITPGQITPHYGWLCVDGHWLLTNEKGEGI